MDGWMDGCCDGAEALVGHGGALGLGSKDTLEGA